MSIEIPGYKILSELGAGGMATVYLALQESLERKVALKVMNAALQAVDQTYCERFLNEGKIIAQVSSHPDIVTIYDIGCAGSIYYMAMEYVQGGSLKERIERGIDEARAVDILRHIAGALGYAHNHGFVHRDVKPANILFREDDVATLTDFGIAKSVSSGKQLTQLGFAVGTPEYMSPEQAKGHTLDGRSDLYALGIVFYEMLTGRRPFTSDDTLATALMHINQPVPVLPEASARYQPIIDGLLAKHPEQRFVDARALIEALDAVAAGVVVKRSAAATAEATLVRPPPGVGRGGNGRPVAWGGRHGRWLIGLAVATLSLGTAAGIYYFGPERATPLPGAAVPADAPIPSAEPKLASPEQERIERLLQVAAAHQAVGRLREPPGANAYDAYQMVLELDPDNAQARRAVQEIERMTTAGP